MDGRLFGHRCTGAYLPRVRLIPALVLVLGALAGLVGCSGDDSPAAPEDPLPTVELQITSDPEISFDAPTGKTRVIVQFIARDASGYGLHPDDVVVELLLDHAEVDNESILQEDAEELSASIYLGLVLDASYSMLLHTPPAFGPMREGARDAVQQGYDLFAGQPGTFSWTASWFNETIFYPAPSGRDWVPDDLLTIPEPGPGTATKLFAAVTHQARRMTEAHEDVASGPHDHHIMVVFSDGADNYSWFDNSSQQSQGVTASGAPFAISGFAAADLDTALVAIAAHPDLTTYVIGLGSDVRDDQLQAIADAGGGRYFKNPSSTQVGALFEQVTREFATIQTHGATMPLPPADYSFTVRVRTADRRARDEFTFSFHAGDSQAGVLR